MKIKIGKNAETDEPVEIDIPTLIGTRMLIQANSGAGKSWTVRRLLEQTHGKVQQIVIDPEGEFASLREKYDYLLVGKEGDIPASIKSADLLARRLLELNTSAIIDLYELKHRERIKYVKHFIDSLVNAPKELWHPCLIIIDEGHIFAPEGSKKETESLSAVIDLCTRGRKRGFSAVIATQRLSKLNKDAAAELLNKLMGRTSLDIDMKRAGDEIGVTTKKDLFKLRELKPGEFLAFGPAISNAVIRTRIGSIKTVHPKVGTKQFYTPPPTSEKVRKILKKLTDLPKEAEKELKDKAQMMGELRRLRGLLREKPKPQADEAALERSRLNGFKEAKRQYEPEIRKVQAEHGLQLRKLQAENLKKHQLIAKAKQLFGIEQDPLIQIEVPKKVVSEFKPIPKKEYASPSVPYPTSNSEIPLHNHMNGNAEIKIRPGARRMLETAAKFHPKSLTRVQIATFVGMASKGGTFTTYLGTLKRGGWLIESSLGLRITEAGLEQAGQVDMLPQTLEGFIDMWIQKFRPGEAKLIRKIAEIYPSSITREELGEETGMTHTGGTFTTYLGTLRRNQLVIAEGNEVRLNPEIEEMLN